MKEYEFVLKFALQDPNDDPEAFVNVLFEAGCDDATVGLGQPGKVALSFTREAPSALDAVSSAIADVQKAIPGTKLIEATPDFVGLTDIANLVGCSRQNIRKIMISNMAVFPPPIHDGNTAIWHLAKVLKWLSERRSFKIEEQLFEVSLVNMQINIERQAQDIGPAFCRKLGKQTENHLLA